MKKIENIIESCKECRYCQEFVHYADPIEVVFICKKSERVLLERHIANPAEKAKRPQILPDWCPLETYKEPEPAESAAPGSAQPEARGTIILPGLPHLEWMTKNLQGFGGTEIDGRWYYTYEQAEEAVKQFGDGWRLPTRGEMVDLDDLGSTWDDDLKGRWFGGNHDTDHDGSLFFPAAGSRAINNGGGLCYVGTYGYVWSSSPVYAGSLNAGYLSFDSGAAHPLFSARRANGCSVRCVRNLQ